MDYSILILNYNGADLLPRCIKHCFQAMEASGARGELIVVDNASIDASREVLSSYGDQLRTVAMKSNTVLCAYNEAVELAMGKIILLLNNDEYIDSGFLDRILKPFEQDPDLFLVVPKTVDEGSRCYQAGLLELEFKRGHFWINSQPKEDRTSKRRHLNVGCLGAYRKEPFRVLGGFEPLFLPFYWEDADLSYRAAKQGWKILYDPEAVSEHLGQATISRFVPDDVRRINRRNKLLFFYLNATDWLLWAKHYLRFPFFVIGSIVSGRNLDYLRAWLWIFLHLPRIWSVRQARKRKSRLKDADLLNLVKIQ